MFKRGGGGVNLEFLIMRMYSQVKERRKAKRKRGGGGGGRKE